MATKRTKYGNIKVRNSLGVFDSTKEYERYLYLMDLQKHGRISGLQRQVPYELLPNMYTAQVVIGVRKTKTVQVLEQRKVTYQADFVYYDEKNQELVVEDVKSSPEVVTPEYKLKKKMMYYFHGIKIKEYYGN